MLKVGKRMFGKEFWCLVAIKNKICLLQLQYKKERNAEIKRKWLFDSSFDKKEAATKLISILPRKACLLVSLPSEQFFYQQISIDDTFSQKERDTYIKDKVQSEFNAEAEELLLDTEVVSKRDGIIRYNLVAVNKQSLSTLSAMHESCESKLVRLESTHLTLAWLAKKQLVEEPLVRELSTKEQPTREQSTKEQYWGVVEFTSDTVYIVMYWGSNLLCSKPFILSEYTNDNFSFAVRLQQKLKQLTTLLNIKYKVTIFVTPFVSSLVSAIDSDDSFAFIELSVAMYQEEETTAADAEQAEFIASVLIYKAMEVD